MTKDNDSQNILGIMNAVHDTLDVLKLIYAKAVKMDLGRFIEISIPAKVPEPLSGSKENLLEILFEKNTLYLYIPNNILGRYYEYVVSIDDIIVVATAYLRFLDEYTSFMCAYANDYEPTSGGDADAGGNDDESSAPTVVIH